MHRYNFNIWRIGVSSATSWWLGSLATPGSHHLLAHPPGPSLWRVYLFGLLLTLRPWLGAHLAAGLRLRDRLRLLPRRPCWVRTAPWCSAGVGTAARLPPSGFLHIFFSASTAWHPLLLLVLTGLASGFFTRFSPAFSGGSFFFCFFLLLPGSHFVFTSSLPRIALTASHSRCPSSAAAPASSPTSASGFSALAGSLATTALCLLATSATRTSAR